MTQISPTALEEAARGLCKSMHGNCNNAGYISDYYTQHATAAITAYLAQREKEGFVMMPREPTVAMRSAVAKFDWESKCDVDWADGYRVMITAASQELNDA